MQLGNNDFMMFIFVPLVLVIFVCILGIIFRRFGPKMQKWLDLKIEAMPDKYEKKPDHLIAEYSTYSTEDLLEELKKIHFKGSSHNYAVFHVLSTRVDEEWIIPRIQQFQKAINPQTRLNANYVMAHYYEKQFNEYSNEELLALLQHTVERNEQEVQALLMVSLSRVEDKRVRHSIYQLLYLEDRRKIFNTEHLIKEYFGKQDIDNNTIDDLLNLLNNMEDRDRQEVAALLSVAESRMKNQKVNLCIEQLQNSKNYLIRVQAKQIMKDYKKTTL